jgi:hypothetical protein
MPGMDAEIYVEPGAESDAPQRMPPIELTALRGRFFGVIVENITAVTPFFNILYAAVQKSFLTIACARSCCQTGVFYI